MAKSKPSLNDDPDLMMPKMARDEVEEQHAAPTLPPAPIVAPIPNPTPVPQSAPVYAPQPSVTVVDVNNGVGNNMMAQQNFQQTQVTAQMQAQASVGLSEASIDKEIVDKQLEQEDEHWMKAYWRPAMGWLYMIICFMDFVGFPMLTIFLPIIFKPFGLVMPYTAWSSITLSNGGLVHLAFGAILGVSALTRGQEKIAGMK